MPAMITHYLLGRRVLPLSGLPAIKRQDAFLLGNQGPDILYFFRAYPWLPGKAGLPLGNALHEVQPSVLIDLIRETEEETPSEEKAIVHSYVQGFLCHYTADRMIHPFVTYWQEQLKELRPAYANDDNPYHYYIESALDTLFLHHENGEYVTAFSLTKVLPKKDKVLEKAIARFYHRLLEKALGQTVPERQLRRLVPDMRQSMRLMTDSTELKGKLIRFYERLRKKGAWYSALLRTKEVVDLDYPNLKHRLWMKGDDNLSKQDFYELCDEVIEEAFKRLVAYENGDDGLSLTGEMNFAGQKYGQEANADETHSEL